MGKVSASLNNEEILIAILIIVYANSIHCALFSKHFSSFFSQAVTTLLWPELPTVPCDKGRPLLPCLCTIDRVAECCKRQQEMLLGNAGEYGLFLFTIIIINNNLKQRGTKKTASYFWNTVLANLSVIKVVIVKCLNNF